MWPWFGSPLKAVVLVNTSRLLRSLCSATRSLDKPTMASGQETKIFYHVDAQPTPYLVKVAGEPGKVTLADFKAALNAPYYKYFFKSVDDEIG